MGFYGGINYGFGYTGLGFSGGYWGNAVFNYNRLALNVGGGVHHVYDHAVVNYTPVNRISFNGRRGIGVQATASEGVAFRERQARPSIQRPEQARPAPVARGPMERPAGPAPGGRPGPGEEQKKRP